ncbi:MAG: Riboflavin synthase eubacterial/eukaryotic, partial [uncultured Acidimicrobiales bacterium]
VHRPDRGDGLRGRAGRPPVHICGGARDHRCRDRRLHRRERLLSHGRRPRCRTVVGRRGRRNPEPQHVGGLAAGRPGEPGTAGATVGPSGWPRGPGPRRRARRRGVRRRRSGRAHSRHAVPGGEGVRGRRRGEPHRGRGPRRPLPRGRHPPHCGGDHPGIAAAGRQGEPGVRHTRQVRRAVAGKM